VFSSQARNLVDGDLNHLVDGPGVVFYGTDIFVRDLVRGTTERISTTSAGTEIEGDSQAPAISTDARLIAFESSGLNLSPGLGLRQVYLKHRDDETLTLVSRNPGGDPGNGQSSRPSMSGDGGILAFDSEATNLVDPPSSEVQSVFAYDVARATLNRLSVGIGGVDPDGPSFGASVSTDGSMVAFVSGASNLVLGDDGEGRPDVFLAAVPSGTLSRIPAGSLGGSASTVAVSDNGCVVAFSIIADAGGGSTVAVRDCTEVVPHVVAEGTLTTDRALSGDGRLLMIDRGDDVFLLDRSSMTETLVSRRSDGAPGRGYSYQGAISKNGRVLALSSSAPDLIEDDTNGDVDVFSSSLDQLCDDGDACTSNRYEGGSCLASDLAGTEKIECELAEPWPPPSCAGDPIPHGVSRVLGRVRRLFQRFADDLGPRRRARVARRTLARIKRAEKAMENAAGWNASICRDDVQTRIDELRSGIRSARPPQ
jgi:Tol biopolymer transport system component